MSREHISKRKQPRDEEEHLDFSLTSHLAHEYAYASRSFKEKMKELKDSLSSDIKNETQNVLSASQPHDHGAKMSSANIQVKKSTTAASPYVVSLKPKEEAAPSQNRADETAQEWQKEVVRLRSRAKKYSQKLSPMRVDLLKAHVRSKKKSLFWYGAKSMQWAGMRIVAVIRLIFELLCAIPLGVLFVLQSILSLIERAASYARLVCRSVGSISSVRIGTMGMQLVGLVRALAIIPLKIASIITAALYRMMLESGTLVSRIALTTASTARVLARNAAKRPGQYLLHLGAVACIAALLVAPLKLVSHSFYQFRFLKGSVLGAAQDGFGAISMIAEGDTAQLDASLALAQSRFSDAQKSLDSVNVVLRGIIELSPQGQTSAHLLAAGENISIAGGFLAEGIAPFTANIEGRGPVIEHLITLSESLKQSLPHLRDAVSNIQAVDADAVPFAYRDKFTHAQRTLPRVYASAAELSSLSDALLALLGHHTKMRYAVLFQNNNELRPAGGFIGSLALVDIRNGELVNIEIPGGGTYDFQGSLLEHVIAPKPLWIVNPHWQLQDANWYADWPTSARKVGWFLENSANTTVDGVIALQATTLQKLLAVLGPIEFSEYEMEPLTSENVINEIQKAVELEYDAEENQPKKYIAELAPKVLERILQGDTGDMLGIVRLLQEEVEQKNILLYFADNAVNEPFVQRNWEPYIKESPHDYLSVVHANIGGGKTDGVIEETRDMTITINEEGEIVNELIITRHHAGEADDPFTSFNNVDFVRAYVPEGSELLSVEGYNRPDDALFEPPLEYYKIDEDLAKIEGRVLIDDQSGTRINNEFNKTAFGNWMQVDPGNTAVYRIMYKLPFTIAPFDLLHLKDEGGYSMLLQKQPGSRPIPHAIVIRYPKNWDVQWKKVAGQGTLTNLGDGIVQFNVILSKDTGFAVLFVKKEQ